jgi:hypothetical protein
MQHWRCSRMARQRASSPWGSRGPSGPLRRLRRRQRRWPALPSPARGCSACKGSRPATGPEPCLSFGASEREGGPGLGWAVTCSYCLVSEMGRGRRTTPQSCGRRGAGRGRGWAGRAMCCCCCVRGSDERLTANALVQCCACLPLHLQPRLQHIQRAHHSGSDGACGEGRCAGRVAGGVLVTSGQAGLLSSLQLLSSAKPEAWGTAGQGRRQEAAAGGVAGAAGGGGVGKLTGDASRQCI